MERHIDQDLEDIRQNLLRMGADAGEMAGLAIKALIDRDSDTAALIIERDRALDALEKKIDEDCHSILALHQPTAGDLRFLISVIRITGELERIGDCSKNICESVIELNGEPPIKPYVDLPEMSRIAGEMLRESLDAFARRDASLARDVCRRDNDIDLLYEQVFRELLTFMIEKPHTVSRALHVLLVAQQLERIADHATNVAEAVVYYEEARDIRHTPEGTGSDESQ